jgi:hypothetical protein
MADVCRTRRERPRRRRTADSRDELAPVHSMELHLPPARVAAYSIGEGQVQDSLQCRISLWRMTVVGQKQTSSVTSAKSASRLQADIRQLTSIRSFGAMI